ncbi:unnamed protein product [Lota lota]
MKLWRRWRPLLNSEAEHSEIRPDPSNATEAESKIPFGGSSPVGAHNKSTASSPPFQNPIHAGAAFRKQDGRGDCAEPKGSGGQVFH